MRHIAAEAYSLSVAVEPARVPQGDSISWFWGALAAAATPEAVLLRDAGILEPKADTLAARAGLDGPPPQGGDPCRLCVEAYVEMRMDSGDRSPNPDYAAAGERLSESVRRAIESMAIPELADAEVRVISAGKAGQRPDWVMAVLHDTWHRESGDAEAAPENHERYTASVIYGMPVPTIDHCPPTARRGRSLRECHAVRGLWYASGSKDTERLRRADVMAISDQRVEALRVKASNEAAAGECLAALSSTELREIAEALQELKERRQYDVRQQDDVRQLFPGAH